MSGQKTNLVLIGMAGAGKSTVGPLLARLASTGFVDVDALIEADQRQPLQSLVDGHGAAWFRELEERIILGLDVSDSVIATGGSAVYGTAAMDHLRTMGRVIFLDVPLSVLEQRVSDVETRGLAREVGQSFAQLFAERLPLYQRYADITIPCAGKGVAEICAEILAEVERAGVGRC